LLKEIKMTAKNQPPVAEAARIPPLSHSEAGGIAQVELQRFLALVKSLTDDDWEKPTDCTLWNVRQVLAHQVGSYASFASWAEFKRQWSKALKPQPGQLPVDALNQLQIEERANASPAELIAELEEVGPKAITTRQRLPVFLRALRLPFGPPLGTVRLDYLTDLIYPRDTWIHRLDICRATGREMVLTGDHDGRMIALVMRDLATKFERNLKEVSVIFDLTGPAGGCWRIGPAPEPVATIQMDTLDFSRLTSGRLAPDEVKSHSLVSIRGDVAVGFQVLDNAAVPY
jgi:uncharacterized protein (TIGR03083 family)